ncbi:hypothetical protein Tco_0698843 [Tanacetum coccineum]
MPEYDESQFKIEVFTPGKPVVTIAEFLHGAVKKMVVTIRECEQNSHCNDAKIHKIHKESGWAYTSCKHCNKKMNVVETKATTSSSKSKVTFYCEDDGAVQAKSSVTQNLSGRLTAWRAYGKATDDEEGLQPLQIGTKIVALMSQALQRVLDLPYTTKAQWRAFGSGVLLILTASN